MLTQLAGNNFGDTREGLGVPLALLFIVLLGLATIFLIRNMNARLRRLPDRFPDRTGRDPAQPPADQQDPPDNARSDGGS
jgi:hypothetical protein